MLKDIFWDSNSMEELVNRDVSFLFLLEKNRDVSVETSEKHACLPSLRLFDMFYGKMIYRSKKCYLSIGKGNLFLVLFFIIIIKISNYIPSQCFIKIQSHLLVSNNTYDDLDQEVTWLWICSNSRGNDN